MADPIFEVVPDQEVYFYYDQRGDLNHMLGRRLNLFVSTDGTYAVTEGLNLVEHNLQRIRFSPGTLTIDDRVIILDNEIEVDVKQFNLQEDDHLYGYIKLVKNDNDKECPLYELELLVSKDEKELQCDTCYKFFEFIRHGNELVPVVYPKRAFFVNLSANFIDVYKVTNEGETRVSYKPITRVLKVFLNGVLLEENTDYKILATTREIEFLRPLSSNELVIIRGFA